MFARLSGTGKHRDIAKAHIAADSVNKRAGRWTVAAEHARLAAEHARLAGDDGLRSRALSSYLVSIMYGPHSTEAVTQALDTIEREEPGPYLAAYVNRGRGEVARLEGRFGDARRLLRVATDAFLALGLLDRVAGCEQDRVWTELSAGDAAAAVEASLRSDAILTGVGDASFHATSQALLAQSYERLGNFDAARAALEVAESIGAPDDVITYAITRCVRARLALGEGDRDAAERWARSAVDRSSATDDIVIRAEATLELAGVLLERDSRDEAVAQAQTALDLFVAKGHRPGADLAQALLAQLGSRARP
jgi:tetratricopeptide (TPR) repeat protein